MFGLVDVGGFGGSDVILKGLAHANFQYPAINSAWIHAQVHCKSETATDVLTPKHLNAWNRFGHQSQIVSESGIRA
jgi:hypothetical protein